MITGEKELRKLYPDLDENQYQPSGIDLTLNHISKIKHRNKTTYGLLQNKKLLPNLEKQETTEVEIEEDTFNVYQLQPHTSYIATTNEKIKIPKQSGQFYLPRSSLLRAGIDVRTAFGDPGFNGHLSFLIINHTDYPFIIEENTRFAQLINMGAENVEVEYDGDYQEK